jgi:hypothetical protein
MAQQAAIKRSKEDALVEARHALHALEKETGTDSGEIAGAARCPGRCAVFVLWTRTPPRQMRFWPAWPHCER